jgi:hypothetical protein
VVRVTTSKVTVLCDAGFGVGDVLNNAIVALCV